MLLPIEIDSIPQKKGCKRNFVWVSGSAGGKIVFTLLAEVVRLHVEPIAVEVRSLSLELVSQSTLGRGLEEHLNDSI